VGFSNAELTATVQADFDQIALLSDTGWNHNKHYHACLMRHAPVHCAWALDIGCGKGSFSRLLATRSDRVLALDLSPQMIRIAKERSQRHSNIDYQVCDASTWGSPNEQFDCIASVAVLHHLPMRSVLARMKSALRRGGSLLILDLYRQQGLRDAFASVLAAPFSAPLQLLRNGRLRQPAEIRRAWAEHGKHDSYLTLTDVRRFCDELLPGATVKRHLLWRYSVVWRKV
jgi:2-polyprenyl-3-methyl-5-hydroxy-6-metoxy-1,4-benzoquinol methylase